MKYLTDEFLLCFLFALATLNSSDVVETVTFKTETLLKLRDQGLIKNSETDTRDLKFENETSSQIPRPRLQNLWIVPKFFKINRHHFPSWTFLNFSHYSDLFSLFLTCKYKRKNSLNCSFTKLYPCNFLSQNNRLVTEIRVAFETETRNIGPRDDSWGRDQVSRLHHCQIAMLYFCIGNTIVILTDNWLHYICFILSLHSGI